MLDGGQRGDRSCGAREAAFSAGPTGKPLRDSRNGLQGLIDFVAQSTECCGGRGVIGEVGFRQPDHTEREAHRPFRFFATGEGEFGAPPANVDHRHLPASVSNNQIHAQKRAVGLFVSGENRHVKPDLPFHLREKIGLIVRLPHGTGGHHRETVDLERVQGRLEMEQRGDGTRGRFGADRRTDGEPFPQARHPLLQMEAFECVGRSDFCHK